MAKCHKVGAKLVVSFVVGKILNEKVSIQQTFRRFSPYCAQIIGHHCPATPAAAAAR